VLRLENVNLRNATAQRATEREVPAPPDASGSPLHRSVTRPVTTPLYQARQRPNINACELLTEFKGTSDVYWRWEKQFKLLCETYELDDQAARILVGMRLKDQALKWFHSRPEHLEISVEELLAEMRKMFDHRPAKITLRKNFERRVWQATELFSEYFHKKVTLANRVPVDEDEAIDYLIEGIPDMHLRNQAKVQRFSTKEELLEAFERVRLECEKKGRPPRANDKARGDVSDSVANQDKLQPLKKMRCYNCNEVGHKSQDCQQPKREKSSCFGCGQTDHRIRDCPRRIRKAWSRKKHEIRRKSQRTWKRSRSESWKNKFLET